MRLSPEASVATHPSPSWAWALSWPHPPSDPSPSLLHPSYPQTPAPGFVLGMGLLGAGAAGVGGAEAEEEPGVRGAGSKERF